MKITIVTWGSHGNVQLYVALGLGLPPILQQQLSAERLVAAIRAATSDKAMQVRTAVMGKRIQAEDGVARAVEAFHRYLPSNRLHPGAHDLKQAKTKILISYS